MAKKFKAQLTPDEFGKLDATFQEYYTKETIDGTEVYSLGVTEVNGYKLAEVSRLQTALSNARSELDAATRKVKAFGDITPEQVTELQTKLNEMKDWKPDKKTQELIDSQRTQLVTAHEKALKAIKDENAELSRELENSILEDGTRRRLEKVTQHVDLMLPHVRKYVRVKRLDDGSRVQEVVDDKGQPAYNEKGDPKTVDELIEEMKNDKRFATAFPSEEGTGGGGGGGSTTGDGTNTGGRKRVIPSSKLIGSGVKLEDVASGEVTVDSTR